MWWDRCRSYIHDSLSISSMHVDQRNKLVTFLTYVQASQVAYQIFNQPVTVQLAIQYTTFLSSLASILVAIGSYANR